MSQLQVGTQNGIQSWGLPAPPHTPCAGTPGIPGSLPCLYSAIPSVKEKEPTALSNPLSRC